MAKFSIIVSLLYLLCVATSTYCAKILLVPVQMKSHMSEVLHTVDELPRRGHQVHLVVSEATSVPKSVYQNNITVLRYKTSQKKHHFESDEFVRENVAAALTETREDDVKGMSGIAERVLDDCREMMADVNLVESIKELKFDIAVVDAFLISPCSAILPYHLSIPFVTVGTDYNPTIHAVPILPSFVPMPLLPYTDRMTFLQRLKNTIASVNLFHVPFTAGQKDTELMTKYGRKKTDKGRSISSLPRECVLSIINTDPVISYPVPTLPRVILAGGLTTMPTKALPKEFDDIFQKSANSVIIVSFGSLAAFLPDHITKKLAEAFSKIPYTVIWRHNGQMPHTLSKNVHIKKWLPQNDLLGHPKTRLFVTHSGNNGQFEAVYNGVPMIGFHLWGDQPLNALRMSIKGFGVKLPLAEFSPTELVRDINEVINNQTYRLNIQRASRIYRDRPMTARETSAFWIEHVLKYGSEHLKSGATDLPWYAYLMLDILALVFTIVISSLAIIYLGVCFIVGKCRRRNVDVKKKRI